MADMVVCPHCKRQTETLWLVTVDGELAQMCPGDVADLRISGQPVTVGVQELAA